MTLDGLVSGSVKSSGVPAPITVDRTNPTPVAAPAAEAPAPALADKLESGPSRTPQGSATNVILTADPNEQTSPGKAPTGDISAMWQKVFGDASKGAQTNQLLNDVAYIQAQKDQPTDRPVTPSTTGKKATTRDLPAGKLTANADGSITTPGGYTVKNDGGYQWRVIEPSGKEHRIWGDPHVDENNDGKDDWHFNQDSSFILPDGTKIFCDTDKVSEYGGEDVTLSTALYIQYQDSLGTMDVVNGGAGKVGGGGYVYDAAAKDGDVFVLSDDSTFLDAKTLGDLYDAGGDFKADIDTSTKGTISANAAIAVAASLGRELPTTTATKPRDRDTTIPLGGSLSELVASAYDKGGADLSQEVSGQSAPKQPTKNGITPLTSSQTAAVSSATTLSGLVSDVKQGA